jgi:prevent-host-death family protein
MELSITEFRRQCLALLEHLPEDGIVVTKRGKPLARVTPVRSPRSGKYVVAPLLKGKGKPGPLAPNAETPSDLII